MPLKSLKNTLGELIFDVYMVADKNITYITSSGINQYLVERICGNNTSVNKMKRIYVWELKRIVNRQDAVMVDMHKFFARFFNEFDGFLIPAFVRQIMPVDKPIDEIIKFKNKDLKKMNKFSYEISEDPSMLKYFYEKMYVPYIKRRYGNSAYIESFNILEKIFKNGELLFFRLGEEYVSAALYEVNGDMYFCRKNGILNESSIGEGSLLATYYFSILRAKDKNLKFVDFGQSRPFLSDGVLRHKSLWGAQICEDKTTNRVIYIRNIFEQPFICIEDKKLKGVVFSENDKFIKEYARSGLEFKVAGRQDC